MGRPEDFVAGLNARPGSLQGRPDARQRISAKDVVRESLQATSAENRERIARREETIAKKLEEIRNAPLPQEETNNESEDS